VEFRILGPLDVVEQGRALALGGPRQRSLLALLLTHANEVVSSDRLIDELWEGRPPGSAANALQYHVSQLRKTLAPSDAIVTREPGYLIRVGADELDLLRFEKLVTEAQTAPPEDAARALREALALWRGPALADLAQESFAQPEINRLEELRLAALERRLAADLALGRDAELVGELRELVREHPFREQLRAALMRALYASGRQAEALDVYRQTRELLVEELGIEPSPALQELEQAILRQDSSLATPDGVGAPPGASPARPRQRAIMTVASEEDRLGGLLAIAEPLARQPARELILARLLRDESELAAANAALGERRRALAERGVSCRVAAYTTPEAGRDAALLAREHDVDLILVDAPSDLLERGRLGDDLTGILTGAPCDVGVLVDRGDPAAGPIVTPFGGAEHDWSAIEVAAWLAWSLGTTLRLLGTKADPAAGRRDASRLLARASMMVQQVVGIDTEPMLVPPGQGGVLEGSADARLLVIGLSERWQTEGVGDVRLAVAAGARVPTLFVRRGLRPSGLAPEGTHTRFTWTLGSQRSGVAAGGRSSEG
jgi:DNA-binding SARP family transcriptional activator